LKEAALRRENAGLYEVTHNLSELAADLLQVSIVQLIAILRGRKNPRQGKLPELTSVGAVNPGSLQTMWNSGSGLQSSLQQYFTDEPSSTADSTGQSHASFHNSDNRFITLVQYQPRPEYAQLSNARTRRSI